MKPRLSLNIFSGVASQIVGVLIGLVATPIIINGLGDSLYGLWSVSKAVVAWIAFINMMFSTATVRFLGEALGQAKPDEARLIQRGYNSWAWLSAFVAAIILLLLAPLLSQSIKIEPGYQSLAQRIFYVQAVFVFFEIVAAIPRGVVGAYQRLDVFYFIRTISLALQSIGSAFWVASGEGIWFMVSWIALIQATEFGAFTVYAGRLQNQSIFKGFDIQAARSRGQSLFRYGSRLVSGYAASQLMLPTSYLLISFFRPLEELAYFTVLANLVRNVRTVATQVAGAILPAASERAGKGDQAGLQDLFLKGIRWSWLAMVPLAVGAVGYGDVFIGAWINAEFGLQVKPLVVPLVLGLCLFFLAGIPMVIAQGIGKAGAWAKASLAAGVVNLVLGMVWIPMMGTVGAAWSLLLASVILLTIQSVWARGELGLRYGHLLKSVDLRVLLVSTLAVGLVRMALPEDPVIWEVLLFAGISGLLIITASPIWLPEEERQWVMKRIRKTGSK